MGEPGDEGGAVVEPVTCDHLETEIQGPVAVFRISRPDKLNALTAAFWPQLRGLLDAAAADPAIRAIVLTGSGDKSFSTGGDIEGFAKLTIRRTGAADPAFVIGAGGADAAAGRPVDSAAGH